MLDNKKKKLKLDCFPKELIIWRNDCTNFRPDKLLTVKIMTSLFTYDLWRLNEAIYLASISIHWAFTVWRRSKVVYMHILYYKVIILKLFAIDRIIGYFIESSRLTFMCRPNVNFILIYWDRIQENQSSQEIHDIFRWLINWRLLQGKIHVVNYTIINHHSFF